MSDQPGNGIKLEHRLSTLEAEVKHACSILDQLKAQSATLTISYRGFKVKVIP